MPTPVGHTLAGCCLAAGALRRHPEARPVVVLGILVGANLPDIDLFGALLRPIGVSLSHQGLTHTLSFVLVGAAALAPTLLKSLRLATAWVWATLAGLSHLLLDAVSFDGSAPYGLPLSWPFSAARWQSPLVLFPGTDRGHPLSLRNAFELLAELAWILPFLWLALRGSGVPAAPRQRR